MRSEEFIFCDHSFLSAVIAKFKRSERQISNIANDLKFAAEKINVIIEAEVKEDGLGYKLIVKDLEGLPLEDIAMQVGECAHNLRSSLDNMAYALARLKLDPPADAKKIAFPICLTQKNYEDNWPIKRLERMFHADVIAVIKSIQPYGRSGGDGTPESDPLYVLSSLNNADKHRIPNLVVFAQEKIDFNGAVKYRTSEDASADGAPNAKVNIDPIVPGMTLLDATTKYPIVSVEGHFNIQGRIMLEVDGQYYDAVDYLQMTRGYLMTICSLFDGFFCQKL